MEIDKRSNLEHHHWWIQGGTAGTCPPPPPTGSISFIFAYIFAKKCMRWRSAPPQQVGAPPPMGNPGSATDHVTEAATLAMTIV